MKKAISLAILAWLFSLAALAWQAWVTDSDIEALLGMSEAIGYLRVDTDVESYSCTAVAIGEHLWLSAGHCAPESDKRGSKSRDAADEIIIHPIKQELPTPPDTSVPPITIDSKAASLLAYNSRISLFHRSEPVSSYFPVGGPPLAGSVSWVYPAQGYRAGILSTPEIAKFPLGSKIIFTGNFRGHDVITQGGAQPGFSGAPYVAKGTDGEYYVVGVLDAISIKLYIVYYDMLPLIGLSESPYSLGYSVANSDIFSLLGGDMQ